jgi:hypothetical protein
MLRFQLVRRSLATAVVVMLAAGSSMADESEDSVPKSAPKANDPSPKQEELEEAFSKMLSGATLEGSFTSTGKGADATKLSREKYTLGEVKKLDGNYWLVPARIEYGDKDITVPLMLPVRWAGDTPVIVVDEVVLPGFGAVSARVMFFADHYAGYWKHGRSGGHLFGTISRPEKKRQPETPEKNSPKPARR